ncbi:MAG TPA: lysophospholipid acyltransferase family protein [Phycisphaerales bacterium]|nr:lysophospholipid acyltransferase family protein [Phycisphaerales bacterium]
MDDWKYKPARDGHLAPMDRLRSGSREPGLVSHVVARCAWAGVRAFFRAYNRLTVVGAEHIPREPPFVMVANHGSHLDALVLGACVPPATRHRLYPIAAGDVFFESPVRTVFAAMTINALPIWRKRVGGHALDELKQRLHSGDCAYVLFPEGARTRDGGPLRWKPGIGMLVAGTDIPVVPCRIDGCFGALRPGTKVLRPCPITVTVREPMRFLSHGNDRAGWESIVAALRARVLGGETTGAPPVSENPA